MIELPRPPEELLAQTPPGVRAYVEALEAVVAEQGARIAALEAQLRQDSMTSSRPPASDPPGTQAKRRAPPPETGDRRPGGQPGHPGRHRPPVPEERVDRIIPVAPGACRGCGAALPAARW